MSSPLAPPFPTTYGRTIVRRGGRRCWEVRIVLATALTLLSLGPFSLLVTQVHPSSGISILSPPTETGFHRSSPWQSPLPSDLLLPFYEQQHQGWHNSTIVATIAFGNATKTHLVERWLHSVRTNGGWSSSSSSSQNNCRIAILTDAPPERYQAIRTKNVMVLQAKPEDLMPTALPFKREAMRYKRFKTLILDYLDDFYNINSSHGMEVEHDSMESSPYQLVVYMDVDVVVARPLTALLQDFHDQMIRNDVFLETLSAPSTSSTNISMSASDYDSSRGLERAPFKQKKAPVAMNNKPKGGNGNATRTVSPAAPEEASVTTGSTTINVADASLLPFMAMFTDCPTCARQNTNSGFIILHRTKSKACLQEWNQLFLENADWGVYDQRYLRDIKSNGRCKIYVLTDHHRLYPTWKDMRLLLSATIVHNTNSYNAKKIPAHVQAKYFAHLLPHYYNHYIAASNNATDRSFSDLELF